MKGQALQGPVTAAQFSTTSAKEGAPSGHDISVAEQKIMDFADAVQRTKVKVAYHCRPRKRLNGSFPPKAEISVMSAFDPKRTLKVSRIARSRTPSREFTR
jgi:hypothetical protein